MQRAKYKLPKLTGQQWGYIAGFLDADGCVGWYPNKAGQYGRGAVIFSNTNLTPLRCLKEWLGVGVICLANKGRKATYRATKDCWNYQIHSQNAVVAILKKVEPLLMVKYTRAREVLALLGEG